MKGGIVNSGCGTGGEDHWSTSRFEACTWSGSLTIGALSFLFTLVGFKMRRKDKDGEPQAPRSLSPVLLSQDFGGVIWWLLFNLEVVSLNCVSMDYEQKRLAVYEKALMVTPSPLLVPSATRIVLFLLLRPATQRKIELSSQVLLPLLPLC